MTDAFELAKQADLRRKADAYEGLQRSIDELVAQLERVEEENYFYSTHRRHCKEFLEEIKDLKEDEIKRACAKMLEKWKE